MDNPHRPPFLRALWETIWAYRPRLSTGGLHRLRSLLPTPGNVLFTLLVIGGLFWAGSVGAMPLLQQAADSTSTVAYQGRLADASGNPITATTPMVFRLYNAVTGGVPLWEENWTGSNSVHVSDGLFNVMLGSLTVIPQSVVTGNSNLWLGITVNADNEMQPRVQLGTVPFAVQALTVPDGSITAAKIADGAVTSRKARLQVGSAAGLSALVTLNTVGVGSAVELADTVRTVTIDVPSTVIVSAVFDFGAVSGSTVAGAVIVDGTRLSPVAALGGNNVRATTSTQVQINLDPGTHRLSLSAWLDAGTSGYVERQTSYSYIVVAR